MVGEPVSCHCISKRDGNQLGPIEMVVSLANKTPKLSVSPSTMSSRGEIALLYNLTAAASAKSKTEVDHPCPSEKVDIAGGTPFVCLADLVGQFCWGPVLEGQFCWGPVGHSSELVPVDWLGVLQVVLQVVEDVDEAMHIVEHLMLGSQWFLRDLQLCRGSMCE